MTTPTTLRSTPVLAVLFILMTAGCTPSSVLITDQFPELSRKVEQEFGLETVRNRMQGDKLLQISLINSPYDEAAAEEKYVTAYDIALFVWQASGGRIDPEIIVVTYVKHANYVVFKYTDESDAFPFRTADLDPGMRDSLETMIHLMGEGSVE